MQDLQVRDMVLITPVKEDTLNQQYCDLHTYEKITTADILKKIMDNDNCNKL